MKVALLFLPAWSARLAPLGVACIAAALKQEGHKVNCFDWNVRLFNTLDKDLWDVSNDRFWTLEDPFKSDTLPKIKKYLEEWTDELLQNDYDVIGFSTLRSNKYTTAYVTGLIRKARPNIKIMIGGPAVVTPESALSYFFEEGGIDVAVVGEGEKTVVELLKRWQNAQPINDVMGIFLKGYSRGVPVLMTPRPPSININDLPIPDFTDFNLKEYREQILGIQFSRGCVANCSFCNENTFYWPKFIMKSPEKILGEIKHQIATHGIRTFVSADSLMNGNFATLEKIADLIIEDGISIYWGGNMRVDKRMTPEFLQKLYKAHCEWITFGIESGSDPILKAMRKGITHNDIVAVLKAAHEAGIQVSINIIVGFPGETEEFFEDTVRLLQTCSDYISFISTSVFGLDPNTYIGQNPQKFGIETVPGQNIAWEEGWQEGKNDGLGWRSISGDLTREIRTERIIKLRAFIDNYLKGAARTKIADSL